MTPYDIDMTLAWLRNAGKCAVAPLGDDLVCLVIAGWACCTRVMTDMLPLCLLKMTMCRYGIG